MPEEAQQDCSWMAAAAGGDRAALGRLYDRHAPAMLGLAYHVLKSRRDAEDLLHDVFLEVWNKAGDFDPQRGRVRGWLLMRVRCRAIDRARALQVARRHGLAAPESPAPPPPDLSAGPDAVRARRALETLPKEQRTVMELAYFGGLTGREIAERCGIPVGTVKSRLSAAMKRLRRELGVGGGAR
ncbi:MAG: sigma-70 family RNA polymerase sigma factor [Myxococcota bacterium]